MSVEHQSHGFEHSAEQAAERQHVLEQAATERLKQLEQQTEQAPKPDSAEHRANQAREIINKSELPSEPEPQPAAETAPTRRIPFLNPRLNYQHTLQSLQRHLTPVSRTFSRVIHNPTIERTSDALEKTIARPSVMNGALWTSVLVGAGFYFTARTFGFQLSGSEMPAALLAGAIIGLIVEAVWRAYKH